MVEAFTVVKGGASADNEINAISGASRTSNAVTGAANAGIIFGQYCTENN
ncbi:MAG: FMN-binding protein [Lachnospiraceae bacterium]|nr:FMN-binding protein [Lachnospiraceae bacterium]